MAPPAALRATPKGAALADRQSRIGGALGCVIAFEMNLILSKFLEVQI